MHLGQSRDNPKRNVLGRVGLYVRARKDSACATIGGITGVFII